MTRVATLSFRRAAGLVLLVMAWWFSAAPLQAQTVGPFPDSSQVKGWMRGEVRHFDPEHLYEYIDGDAEKYIKAGVSSTETADYTYDGDVEAVADVYAMTAPQGAQSIFAAEEGGEATAVSIGDAARSYRQSLVFRQGRYLVRVVAYQDTPEIRQALVDLGRAIAATLH